MTTIFDVFAKVIEKAPCTQSELEFKSPVYLHLSRLVDLNFIKKTSSGYVPVKNIKSSAAFKIIKYSIKKGINYNIIFRYEFVNVLKSIKGENIRPKEVRNNLQKLKVLKFLENQQFILVRNKRPKIGTIVYHNIFRFLSKYWGKEIEIHEVYSKDVIHSVLSIPKREIDPFENSYFAFLAGNAQLEGSTITIGETVDLLTKEIYPEKTAKDIQMVKNLDVAMRFVIENLNKKILPEDIKKINEYVLFSLHKGAGRYKKTQNRIAGNPNFKTTPPRLVSIEVEKFCKMCNSISNRRDCLEKLGLIHNDLQRIHPFSDGNSRTTRMVVNWLLARWKFPMIVLKTGSFDKYMSLTKLANKRADYDLKMFLLHVILHEYLIN